MSFMTISGPGLLQDPDSVRVERALQTRVDRLLAALDRVMPDGVQFSDWTRYEGSDIHIDLQVDGTVNQHPLVLAESLATGAHRVYNRYFAAFRQEQALERLESDSNWLSVNAAVHAIEAVGGEVRFHSGKPHERRLAAIDPDFLRLAETWEEVVIVQNQLLLGVEVLPGLDTDVMHSVLLSVEHSTSPYAATISENELLELQPGFVRVCFECIHERGGIRAVVPNTLLTWSIERNVRPEA